MNLNVSHIFRERNTCVDKLDDYKFSSHIIWWNDLFKFIKEDFFPNNFGLLNFHFHLVMYLSFCRFIILDFSLSVFLRNNYTPFS